MPAMDLELGRFIIGKVPGVFTDEYQSELQPETKAVSKRNIWIIVLVALGFFQIEVLKAQEGLKEAQELLRNKQWAKAQEAFDALLLNHGDNFDVRLGMAKAAFGNGDPEIGGTHAARALKLKPKSGEAAAVMGRCFLQQGHRQAANQVDPTALYEQANEAFDLALRTDKRSISLWMDKGSCLYAMGQWTEAGKAYQEAFKLNTKVGSTAYWSGYSFHQGRQLERAAEMYTKALVAGLEAGLQKKAIDGLWNCFKPENRWPGLLKSFSAWVKAKPRNDTALWWKGYVLNAKPDYKEALVTWRQLEKVSRRYGPEAVYFQGVAANALGRQDEAIALFSKAGKMRYGWTDNKNPGLSLHTIAGQLFSNGQMAKACEVAENSALPALKGKNRVALQSDLGLFYRDYGTALRGRNKKKEAHAAFVKSRDFYGDAVKNMVKYKKFSKQWKAQVQNDYGLMFHYHFDDPQTALANYKIALQYDPTNSDACLNYGRIMLRRGKLEDALAVAKQGKSRQDLVALIGQIKRAMGK